LLELKGIKAGYGKIQALHGVDVQVPQGEIVALIGANGAGKTTVLNTISGLIKPGVGELSYLGQSLVGLAPHQIVKLGISHVPEGRRIFGDFSVAENIEMGAFLRTDKVGIIKDKEYCFELFPILKERHKQRAGTLSGGEQQMLAICRALLARPKLLLLDEPSLGLAPLVIRQIFDMITRINLENRTTIFLIEQNAHLALKTAHHAYVLESGLITLAGPAQDLLGDPNIQKAYLGISD